MVLSIFATLSCAPRRPINVRISWFSEGQESGDGEPKTLRRYVKRTHGYQCSLINYILVQQLINSSLKGRTSPLSASNLFSELGNERQSADLRAYNPHPDRRLCLEWRGHGTIASSTMCDPTKAVQDPVADDLAPVDLFVAFVSFFSRLLHALPPPHTLLSSFRCFHRLNSPFFPRYKTNITKMSPRPPFPTSATFHLTHAGALTPLDRIPFQCTGVQHELLVNWQYTT